VVGLLLHEIGIGIGIIGMIESCHDTIEMIGTGGMIEGIEITRLRRDQ